MNHKNGARLQSLFVAPRGLTLIKSFSNLFSEENLENLKINKIQVSFMVLSGKEIVFEGEFIRRIIERNIWVVYGCNLEKAVSEIENLMRTSSVIMKNPKEGYEHQHWCLIELPKLGLTKIPIDATGPKVKAITIANPVSDPRCVKAFREGKRKE